MIRHRSALTTLLLCGFALLGVILVVPALIVFGIQSEPSSVLGAVVDAFGILLLGTGLMLTLTAMLALMLKTRRPTAASAVASILGLAVFAVTASEATTDGALLAVNLAGLALLLCALPLPMGEDEPAGRLPIDSGP